MLRISHSVIFLGHWRVRMTQLNAEYHLAFRINVTLRLNDVLFALV